MNNNIKSTGWFINGITLNFHFYNLMHNNTPIWTITCFSRIETRIYSSDWSVFRKRCNSIITDTWLWCIFIVLYCHCVLCRSFCCSSCSLLQSGKTFCNKRNAKNMLRRIYFSDKMKRAKMCTQFTGTLHNACCVSALSCVHCADSQCIYGAFFFGTVRLCFECDELRWSGVKSSEFPTTCLH